MITFHRQRTVIMFCVLLLTVILSSGTATIAQQQIISAENIKQLRIIKRIDFPDFPLFHPSMAVTKNLMAFAIEPYERGGYKHYIYLLDLDSYSIVNQFEYKKLGRVSIYSLRLDRDGNYVGIATDNGGGSIWDVRESLKLYSIKTNPDLDRFSDFAFSADGMFFAAPNQRLDNEINFYAVVEIHDLKTGNLLKVLKGDTDNYDSVAISKEMQYVAAATGFFSDHPGIINVWDLNTRKLIHTYTAHTDAIANLLFSTDGKTVISSGSETDTTIHMWDLDTGKTKAVIEMQLPILDLALSPDGSLLAAILTDGNIHIWDFATLEELTQLQDLTLMIGQDENYQPGGGITFTPDGTKLVLSEYMGKIQVWGIEP